MATDVSSRSTSRSRRFWELVCAAVPVWGILFGLNVILLVFVGLSLFVATPEGGTYYITIINVALILAFLTVLGLTIRRCRRGDY